jgi:nicotinate-nucleotide adenylyltransferase
MRIGLFGGTFDPPHRGHLAAACAVRDRFALDRVLLAPAAIQPLKPDGAQASFADRLRMVELLCAGTPHLEASAIDGPQPGSAPNYTLNTLRRLRAALTDQRTDPETGPQTSSSVPEIFLIVGADAFLGIRQWHRAEDLLREARWIVVSRPGFDLRALDALDLTPVERSRVEVLGDFVNTVSATEVRERLAEHEDASDLVPPPVLDYIRRHHLYES